MYNQIKLKTMKKLITGFLIAIFYPAFTQITIQSGDMPYNNDTIRISIAYSVDGLDYEATGADYSYDFSNLAVINQRVDTFINSINTPWQYQTVFIPVLIANMAQPLFEFDWIPGYELTDVYRYYKNTNDEFNDVGFAFTFSGIPIPVKYQNPNTIYSFPLNYGDADSSTSSYEIDFLGMAYVSGWKKIVNHADGWGTLKTRYGSFDVLRLKSEVMQYDSIYIDSLNYGFPVKREYTEYKWLGKGEGLPLLQIKDESGILTVHYIDSARQSTFGVEEQYANISGVNLYPNPADDNFNISFELKEPDQIHVDLFGFNGKILYTYPAKRYANGKHTISMSLPATISKVYVIVGIRSKNNAVYQRLMAY